MHNRIVVVEQTSKRFKFHIAAGYTLAVAGGVGGCVLSQTDHLMMAGVGFGLVLVGLIWSLVSKVAAWWYHG